VEKWIKYSVFALIVDIVDNFVDNCG